MKVSFVNIIGLIVYSCLDWEPQVSVTVQRCYGILVGLPKLNPQLPFEAKKITIEGLVHP